MKIYSQSGEQEVIINFLSGIKGNITFLDLGSNDGISLSNTYALSLWGSVGVCVEPSPAAYEKLVETHSIHPDIQCLNFAVSDYVGKSKMYDSGVHLNKNDVALLSTLNKSSYNKWAAVTEFNEIEVDVIDFIGLMKLSRYDKFTFISIDVEGCELQILPQMDLTELGCKLICVEHNSDMKVLNEIKEYCAKYGLVNELLRNAENVILSIP